MTRILAIRAIAEPVSKNSFSIAFIQPSPFVRKSITIVGHPCPRDSVLYGIFLSTSANSERHEINSHSPTWASYMEVRRPVVAWIDANFASVQPNDLWHRSTHGITLKIVQWLHRRNK